MDLIFFRSILILRPHFVKENYNLLLSPFSTHSNLGCFFLYRNTSLIHFLSTHHQTVCKPFEYISIAFLKALQADLGFDLTFGISVFIVRPSSPHRGGGHSENESSSGIPYPILRNQNIMAICIKNWALPSQFGSSLKGKFFVGSTWTWKKVVVSLTVALPVMGGWEKM